MAHSGFFTADAHAVEPREGTEPSPALQLCRTLLSYAES
jgi:hypothetical protein